MKTSPALKLTIMTALAADCSIESEDQLQEETAILLDYIGLKWTHVPNGGYRHKSTAVRLQRMGTKPGIPDVMIFDPCQSRISDQKYVGCAIELKHGKGRVTAHQADWLQWLGERGWYTSLGYSMRQVIETLEYCGYLSEGVSEL